MQDKIRDFPAKEQRFTTALEKLHADREHLKTLLIDPETKLPEFRITIGKTVYTDKKEAAKAFEAAVLKVTRADTPVKIGEFQGFPLSVTVNSPAMGGGITATLQGAYPHKAKLTESFSHNLRKFEATLYNIDRKISDVSTDLAKLRVDYQEAQKIVAEPFPLSQELADKESRLKALTEELNLAAIEAKKNAKPKEKTCYFDNARRKKEVMRLRQKKESKDEKGINLQEAALE